MNEHATRLDVDITEELAAPAMDRVRHSAEPLAAMTPPPRSATTSTESGNENSDSTTHPGLEDRCASIIAAGPEAGRAEAVLPGKCPPPSLIARVGERPETGSRSDDAEMRKVHLVRVGDGDKPFRLARGPRLKNNLSWVVGCLELANAGDFAANVWNELPVPLFVAVLMGVGGTLAAVMSIFAFRDARRAWRNIRFLRQQRRELRLRRRQHGPASGSDGEKCPDEPESRALDVLLAVSFRELGGEVINRWAMDVLMGFGAVLISAGTFMAIGGGTADKVFLASNLLSGWIGNTPIAAFGLVNAAWAIYVWLAAQAHVRATRRLLPGSGAAGLVRRRSRNLQVFCVINGSASVLGGVASMLTSIYWWGMSSSSPSLSPPSSATSGGVQGSATRDPRPGRASWGLWCRASWPGGSSSPPEPRSSCESDRSRSERTRRSSSG